MAAAPSSTSTSNKVAKIKAAVLELVVKELRNGHKICYLPHTQQLPSPVREASPGKLCTTSDLSAIWALH